jgi:5,6-dimethylbenzimidazole synthase
VVDQAFSEAERAAVYRAIRERRDVRRFLPRPVPDAVLWRLLQAASQAPSVGYSQPWNFLLIHSLEVRCQVHRAFLEANQEAERLFPPERRGLYASLKLEGILDSSLNVCVTCDRSRFGPVVLGRTCQPDTDLFSTACAVQNLWLAARAEGVAVGWVSIVKPEDLRRILGLPEAVVPVAYLCVGYTESFAAEPELKSKGWLPEVPLSELVYYDHWGSRSPAPPNPGETS